MNASGYSASHALSSSILPMSPPTGVSPTNANNNSSRNFGTMNVGGGGQLNELQSSASSFGAGVAQCYFQAAAAPEFVGPGFDNSTNGYLGQYDAVGRVAGFSPHFEKWRRCALLNMVRG